MLSCLSNVLRDGYLAEMRVSRKRRIMLVAAALVAVVAGSWLAIRPAAAVLLCPTCFGFERVDTNVYVHRSMTSEQQETLVNSVAFARIRIDDFYGSRIGDPRILACGNEDCYWRLGGVSAKGSAWSSVGVRLSPRGLTSTIAAHELAHIEFHARIGWSALANESVPSWFDEGLAVLVADDRRYLKSPESADRCTAEPTGELPTNFRAWGERASRDHELYAKSACRVWRWFDVSGTEALTALIDGIREGGQFVQYFRDTPVPPDGSPQPSRAS